MKTPASVVPMPKNSFGLMPPRNSTPIATDTITISAPRSGSRMIRMPTTASAAAIGMKPRLNWCIISCLRVA